MKISYIVYILFCLCSFLGGDESQEYCFQGVHFLASYTGCNQQALENVEALEKVMQEATLASGATILKVASCIFPSNGLTLVILLSESHASIHTYPEHAACFVDLFTCGSRCFHQKFDALLQEYLQPSKVEIRTLVRNEQIDDIPK